MSGKMKLWLKLQVGEMPMTEFSSLLGTNYSKPSPK